MNKEDFVETVSSVPAPPCDWFGGCLHKAECSKGKSCESFQRYVDESNAAKPPMKHPSQEWYEYTFFNPSSMSNKEAAAASKKLLSEAKLQDKIERARVVALLSETHWRLTCTKTTAQ